MLFSDSYLTISGPAEGLFRDRGSRFIGFAYPVSSEQDIRSRLSAVKKPHPSAVHHCYAWRLGPSGEAFRSNDDGEPSNTAGRPILQQIQSRSITNVLVIVVRYFGGTLLGVSGLIHAYRSAAAEALDAARTEERFILFEYRIEFSFEDMNAVMRLLKETGCKILSQDFDASNTVTFLLKKKDLSVFESAIEKLYRVKLHYLKII